jgi:serine/threonine protein kinase
LAGDGAASITLSDSLVGTPAYMAPEQARSARNASAWSDQYSLAALLYQCVVGKPPFSGASVYEIVESIMTTPLAPPSVHANGIPRVLDEAVLRALSLNPDDRFPSVRAFGEALLPLASQRTRLALASEFDEGACPPPSDAGDAVATDLRVVHHGPVLTTVGETSSRTESSATLSRLVRGTWIGAAAVVLWFASMAFGRESTPPRSDLAVGSPITRAEPIMPSPSARVADAALSSVRQASPASVASSPHPARPVDPGMPRARSHGRSLPDAVPRAAVTLGDNDAPILP